jgi:hypothetical protein
MLIVQVAAAEDKTAGGVLLTDSAKEKPVIGKVMCFNNMDIKQCWAVLGIWCLLITNKVDWKCCKAISLLSPLGKHKVLSYLLEKAQNLVLSLICLRRLNICLQT